MGFGNYGQAYSGFYGKATTDDVQAMNVIRLRMRSQTTTSYALRLVDGTGQCHQRKGLRASTWSPQTTSSAPAT